eukprot:TRINITY_DN3084_c0_g1_i1.p1 TRINITY_DN3084_c0_g1~~TRINITY_DN3084_c0_g1_i1.p1  ORF type:complete len:278 (+),score=46.77 TRINITY_DN3084_c0_g1_i1:108-941(+)
MRQYLFIVIFAALSLAEDSPDNNQVIDACKDVDGTLHKLGDSYIGPDACNKCKCLESGSACTKKFCPKDSSSRSAEAFKCVDNMGVLHEVNQSYTHVDGCNTCKCMEHGGACTRKFCLKKEERTLSSCVDADGNAKLLDEAWLDKDGCNKCVCGILGAVCTEMFCGEHRMYENEADQVKVHEVIHTDQGDIVDESGDQPCKDEDDNTQWPGNSWLSKDSCNICTCPGNGTSPICTQMGCRVRLERLLQSNLTGGVGVKTNNLVTISLIVSVVFAAFL